MHVRRPNMRIIKYWYQIASAKYLVELRMYVHAYLTGFTKRSLKRTIIDIEKSHFEILNIVYYENAWCLILAILHQSIYVVMYAR